MWICTDLGGLKPILIDLWKPSTIFTDHHDYTQIFVDLRGSLQIFSDYLYEGLKVYATFKIQLLTLKKSIALYSMKFLKDLEYRYKSIQYSVSLYEWLEDYSTFKKYQKTSGQACRSQEIYTMKCLDNQSNLYKTKRYFVCLYDSIHLLRYDKIENVQPLRSP